MFQDFEFKGSNQSIIIFNKKKEKILEINKGVLSLNDVTIIVDKPDKWSEDHSDLIIPCDGPTGKTEIRINQKGEIAF